MIGYLLLLLAPPPSGDGHPFITAREILAGPEGMQRLANARSLPGKTTGTESETGKGAG